jgi:hypothetical protein
LLGDAFFISAMMAGVRAAQRRAKIAAARARDSFPPGAPIRGGDFL